MVLFWPASEAGFQRAYSFSRPANGNKSSKLEACRLHFTPPPNSLDLTRLPRKSLELCLLAQEEGLGSGCTLAFLLGWQFLARMAPRLLQSGNFVNSAADWSVTGKRCQVSPRHLSVHRRERESAGGGGAQLCCGIFT